MDINNFSLIDWVINPLSIYPIPAPPPPWILGDATWNDNNQWVDAETWNDGV